MLKKENLSYKFMMMCWLCKLTCLRMMQHLTLIGLVMDGMFYYKKLIICFANLIA